MEVYFGVRNGNYFVSQTTNQIAIELSIVSFKIHDMIKFPVKNILTKFLLDATNSDNRHLPISIRFVLRDSIFYSLR